MARAVVACLGLALLAVAAAASSPLVLRVALEADVPFTYNATEWRDAGRAHPNEALQVTFALKQRDPAALLRYFEAVSNPTDAWYGAYLTRDQLTRFTAVTPEHLESVRAFVRSFLEAAGLPEAWEKRASLSANRDFLHVTVPVAVGEAMFNVQLNRFYPAATSNGRYFLRAHTHYSVPADVAEAVDFVGGLNRLPSLAARSVSSPAPAVSAVDSTSNSPQILSLLGGANVLAAVIPRCSDGSVMPTYNKCGGAASAAPAHQLSITIDYNQAGVGPGVSSVIDVGMPNCRACSAYPRTLDYGNAVHRFCSGALSAADQSALVCLVPATNVATAVNTTATVVATFVTGAKSAAAALVSYVEPAVTPAFIKKQYGLLTPGLHLGSQSVSEFLGQYYSPKDLQYYLAYYSVKPSFSVNVIGPNVASDPGGEATLDIQVMQGVAPGINTSFWSTAGLRNNSQPTGPSNQEPFLTWIMALMDNPDPPLIHSSSYSDKEVNMPRPFTDRLNVEFQKAGVRGLSLFFATGDDGASGITCRYGNCSIFNPTFPPSSPYVTSVGGTQIGRYKDTPTDQVEVVADSVTGSFITSGGGFSNRYAQPSYQSMAVQSYIKTAVMPPASMDYNTSNRAYPDVSAISTNFIIVLNGSLSPIGGTSASTPTTASIYSLLNEYRLQAKMPPLGFINPLLYSLQHSSVPYFNDIVAGNNKCSAISTNCAKYGFVAAPGWDACTGLGSPVFNLLGNAVVPVTGQFAANVTQNTVFSVTSTKLLAPLGKWSEGTQAVVEIRGAVNDFAVASGDVAYKIYETGVSKQVTSGSANYFHCTPQQCNPSNPIALFLSDPSDPNTDYTLRFTFRMPKSQASGEFQVLIHGTDQDKNADLNVILSYNYTSPM